MAWKEVKRRLKPFSVQVVPATSSQTYSHAFAVYEVWQESVPKTENEKIEYRIVEELTDSVYLHERGDLALAFAIIPPAIAQIMAAILEKESKKK